MKILIKITKEILFASRGCQRKTMDCVIARAVREIFPRASVLGHSIFINKSDVGTEKSLRENFDYVELPETAYQLIRKFDACKNDDEVMALPLIQFEIFLTPKILDKVIEEISLGEVYKILSESKTLELVSINQPLTV